MNKSLTLLFLVFISFVVVVTLSTLENHKHESETIITLVDSTPPEYHVYVRQEVFIHTDVESSVETVEETTEVCVTSEEIIPEETFEGVLKPSNLTPEQLEEGLLYNLKDYSEVFIQAEKDTGVNAVFLASIAALESGWGRSDLALYNNNLYGWTSSSGYAYFSSYGECILTVAENLKSMYLQPDGKYFSGYEVSDVNKHYNGSKFWEDNVQDIMTQIQNRIGG